MKKLLLLILVLYAWCGHAQTAKKVSLKEVLINQLRSTHNQKEWFVPATIAIAGLTPAQAMWTDGSGNHSVGQLTYHIVFWNERELAKFQHQTLATFDGNNEETFNSFDEKTWPELVVRLDAVLTNLEKVIQQADEKTLAEWAGEVANISTHNAYHTGQIIFLRKLQGSWNPENGVK